MRKILLSALIALLSVAPLSAQGLSDPALQAAIGAAEQVVPNLGRPLRWEFEILLPTNDSALSCPLVPGVQLAQSAAPYIVTLYYPEDITYTVHVASDGSRTQRCDTDFPGMGMGVPLPPPSAPDVCTVTPSGPFANVRVEPNTDATQVGVIESARPALGRDADWTWYLVAEGWVAGTVVNTSGNCLSNDLSIRSSTIALNLTPPPPTPGPGMPVSTAAPLTTPIPDFTCPPNFEGYLAPRIRQGAATALVEQGGIPNSIRLLPTTDSERIGQIQPGRRLDNIWSGPQCSGGFVWWEVEIDGVRGWTAESNAADGSYYLAPTPGNEVATPAATVATTAPVDSGGIGIITANAPQLVEVTRTSAGFADSVTVIRADDGIGIIRENTLTIAPWRSPDAGSTAGLTNELTFTTVAALTDEVYAGQSDGTLTIYETATGLPQGSFTAHDSPINAIAFSTDQTLIATGSGDLTTDATTWTLRLWDREILLNGETPTPLRSIRFPYPVTDIAFSGDAQYMAVIAEQTGPEAAAALWVYSEGGLGENLLTLALSGTDGSAFVTAFPGDRGDFLFPNDSALSSLIVADSNVETLLTLDVQILTEATFNSASSDTLAVAARGEGGGVTLYNAAGLPSVPVATLPSPALDVSFNDAGDVLAILAEDGSLIFYQIPG